LAYDARNETFVYNVIKINLEETTMFGLGLPELGIIAVVALLIFGPKKLPELGSAIGQTLRGLKEGVKESSSETEKENKEEE
jgi:sec-independent protein translocase protein TatA